MESRGPIRVAPEPTPDFGNERSMGLKEFSKATVVCVGRDRAKASLNGLVTWCRGRDSFPTIHSLQCSFCTTAIDNVLER